MSRASLRPLVLTGGPGVGKSTTARLLAGTRDRAAVVDVDDVRQLVVAGHAAPWDGAEGAAQQRLGVRNACALATSFLATGFDVVVADVLTPETAKVYRDLLQGPLLVRIVVEPDEARRRAALRSWSLTDEEFHALHRADSEHPPEVDMTLVADHLDPDAQAAAVAAAWCAG